MNSKLFIVLSVLTLLTEIGSSAVTISARNFTSTTSGITILTASGAPATGANTFFAAVSFEAGTNFNGTIAEILERMTIVSSVAAAGTPTGGLVNTGVVYNGGSSTAPTAVVGSPMYIVFGDGNTILNSVNLAIFNPGINFISGDVVGNAAVTATFETAGKVVWGIVDTEAPVTQPAQAGFTFPASVRLTGIPEPSALLLGALGLIPIVRRRR